MILRRKRCVWESDCCDDRLNDKIFCNLCVDYRENDWVDCFYGI